MTRRDWLEARRLGVCASDSAAILGLSQWTTAKEVWAEKLSILPPSKETLSKSMGQLMEPVIAAMYADHKKVILEKPGHIDTHPVYTWLRASLDYKYANQKCIVECKNTRTPIGWGDEGTDEVPIQYWVQTQHQMFVTGIPMCDIAVLIAGSEFRVYSISADKDFQESMLPALADFWTNYVLARKEPPSDWEHPSTPALMNRLYGNVTSETIELGLDSQRMAKEVVFLQEVEKKTREEINVLKGKLREAIGDAKAATLPNGWELVRNRVNRGAYEVAATSYVDLRIRQKKGKS